MARERSLAGADIEDAKRKATIGDCGDLARDQPPQAQPAVTEVRRSSLVVEMLIVDELLQRCMGGERLRRPHRAVAAVTYGHTEALPVGVDGSGRVFL